jgi:hypothetical protein
MSEAAQKRQSILGFAIPVMKSVAASRLPLNNPAPVSSSSLYALEYAHSKPSSAAYE